MTIAASLEENSEHPLATAVVKKAKEDKIALAQVKNFAAIEGKGVRASYDGQTAFVGSDRLLEDISISQEMKDQAIKLQKEAKTVVYVGLGQEIIGLIAIQDVPKPSSKAAIAELKKRGLKTIMLTGDNPNVANAIGKEVSIDQVIAGVCQLKRLLKLRSCKMKVERLPS